MRPSIKRQRGGAVQTTNDELSRFAVLLTVPRSHFPKIFHLFSGSESLDDDRSLRRFFDAADDRGCFVPFVANALKQFVRLALLDGD